MILVVLLLSPCFMHVGRSVFSQGDRATPAPVEGKLNCLISPFLRMSIRILVEGPALSSKSKYFLVASMGPRYPDLTII